MNALSVYKSQLEEEAESKSVGNLNQSLKMC